LRAGVSYSDDGIGLKGTDMGADFSQLISDIFGRVFEKAWETKCVFEGHQVAVRITYQEVKLYIDGVKVDSSKTSVFPERDIAFVRGAIKGGDRTSIVEVYGQSAWWGRPKIKICVDGQKIAGDEF
jgi:hypothetical protein